MAIGTAGTLLYYNGVNFGPYTETLSFSIRPELDSSGRTVKWYAYSLTFKSYAEGTTSASLMSGFRAALGKTGGVFMYTGRGTGDIYVNTRGIRDVKNGPITREIGYKPLGGTAVELVWSIEFAIPECADAKFIGAPAEFNFTVQYAIDPKGYTTRTLNGRLAIPSNRLVPGSNRIEDSADRFWERCVPPLQPEFRRTFGPRTLSEDRSEITWSVVDEELRGPAPPPGVFDQDGSTSFNSDTGLGVNWSGTLTYTAELAKGGSIDDAIKGFQQFVQWRFTKMGGMKVTTTKGVMRSQPIPLTWAISEPSAFKDKTVNVSVTFTVAADIDEVFNRSGMWTLVPGQGNWNEWSQSMAATAFSPRGWAKLAFNSADDRIIDLCGGSTTNLLPTPVAPERAALNGVVMNLFPPVNPNNSWLYFDNVIRVERDDGVVSTRTLSTTALTKQTDRDGQLVANNNFTTGGAGGVVGGSVGNGGGNPFPGLVTGRIEPEYSIQGNNSATRVARPKSVVVMEGRALRARFPVPEPTLKTVLGVNVIPASRLDQGEGFHQKVTWNNGRDAIYKAWWKLRYAVDGDLPAGAMPVAPSPLMGNKV